MRQINIEKLLEKRRTMSFGGKKREKLQQGNKYAINMKTVNEERQTKRETKSQKIKQTNKQ